MYPRFLFIEKGVLDVHEELHQTDLAPNASHIVALSHNNDGDNQTAAFAIVVLDQVAAVVIVDYVDVIDANAQLRLSDVTQAQPQVERAITQVITQNLTR